MIVVNVIIKMIWMQDCDFEMKRYMSMHCFYGDDRMLITPSVRKMERMIEVLVEE